MNIQGTATLPRATISRTPIAGLVLIAILLGGSRWVTTITVGPVFISDVLILVVVFNWLVAFSRSPARTTTGGAVSRWLWLVIGLFLWAVSHLMLGKIGMEELRAFAPYLYLLIAVPVAFSVRTADEDAKLRAGKVLSWALAFHAGWAIVVTLILPDLPERLPLVPGSSSRLFEPRIDYEPILTATYVALVLNRLILGRAKRPLIAWLLVTLGVASILAGMSRAGLLGAAVVIGWGVASSFATREGPRERKLVAFGLLPLGVGALFYSLPSTTVGVRLLSFLEGGSSRLALGAINTSNARQDSWYVLLDWLTAEPFRMWFGVGFDVDFMFASGAIAPLLGGRVPTFDTSAFGPHNFWLHVWARLGVVGLLAFAAIYLGHVRRAIKYAGIAGSKEFEFLIFALPMAMLFPASLGVVLEGPFGMIPFAWALGASIGAVAYRRDQITPTSSP